MQVRNFWGKTTKFLRIKYLDLVIGFLTVIVALSVILSLFPGIQTIIEVNERLAGITNLISYLSTVYTAAALVVALIAYRAAIKSPQLRVRMLPWMGQFNKLALVVTPSKRVDLTRPNTSWQLWIENSGNATAKFPIVQLEFENFYFGQEDFKGWEKVLHANALGWYGIRWSPGADVVVHPNFPLELPTLYFSGMYIGSTDMSVTVTVAADGFEPVHVKHIVNLIRTSADYDWKFWDNNKKS